MAGVDFDAIGEGLGGARRDPFRWLRPLKMAFRALGVDVRRTRQEVLPLDLRGRIDDPLVGFVMARGNSYVMDVPLHRLRNLLAFRPLRAAGDPMVEVAHRAFEARSRADLRLPFETFYAAWRPRTRAEYYGIADRDASSLLRALPAWSTFGPSAEDDDPVQAATNAASQYRRENADHGHAIGLRHGHPVCGPWSAQKIDVELRRIDLLIESLLRNGFRPDALLTGRLSIGSDGDWAVSVYGGQHRLAAAEAFGLPSLPILFQPSLPPLRRQEIPLWGQIRNGVFTSEQAVRIFDRVLAGEPPPGCPHPGSPQRLGWQAAGGDGSV